MDFDRISPWLLALALAVVVLLINLGWYLWTAAECGSC